MPVELQTLVGKSYTVKEAAAVLELTPDSVRRLVREGRLRAVRMPGTRKYRFLGADLARYLKGEPPIGGTHAVS
jgi:excisionase family DNA binding protein